MSKRMIGVSVMTALLVAGLGVGLHAHLSGYKNVNGYLVHVSSFDATIELRGAGNTDNDPAAVVVQSKWKVVKTLCENPANHNVLPGQASLGEGVVVVAGRQITAADVTGKGKVEVTIHNIPTEPEELGSEEEQNAFCVNPNWNLIDVLVTKLDVTFFAVDCLDACPNFDTYELSECVETPGGPLEWSCGFGEVAYRQTLECTLPPEVGFDWNGGPVNYDCKRIDEQHVS